MKNSKGLIFLHGAGLNKDIWQQVTPHLHYPALAINYPNRNKGDQANQHLTFSDYVEDVVVQIKNRSFENFILVAHSIGGVVGLKVADQFKNQVKGFVGVGAAIPENGGSFISCLPFPKNLLMTLILKFLGTKPPESLIKNGLCNDLSEIQSQQIIKNFTPEAKSLYFDKSNAPVPQTKTMYIKLTNDNEFPLSLQNKMAKQLKAKETASLDSGHLPMIKQPEELARILNNFADSIFIPSK